MNLMYICFTLKKIFSVLYGTFWSNIKLRLWGCKVTGVAKCFGVPYIEKFPGAQIKIGKHVDLRSAMISNSAGCFHPIVLSARKQGLIEIGNNCGISSSVIVSEESIKIGNNVLIGVNCIISDTDFHSVEHEVRRTPALDKKMHKTRPVVIEDDVWLGMNVTVLKGVTVGRGSVIAAGSVVVKDIPPDSLAGGNPAKVIKKIK
ncbi:MAG: acyltransferase [Lentisphaerae bacterium]|nr:acyltransferase [Lentisphaerota bacterium]